MKPFLITSVDWRTFQEVCRDINGFVPTRGLDEAQIKLTDPEALLASLDMNNDPMYALRNPHSVWHLVSCGFIGRVDAKIRDEIRNTVVLQTYNKNDCFVMVGTIFQWVAAIYFGSSETVSKELRQIFNEIFGYFNRTGFREVFSCFQTVDLLDDTFTLRARL